jgi:hypothetical protein
MAHNFQEKENSEIKLPTYISTFTKMYLYGFRVSETKYGKR